MIKLLLENLKNTNMPLNHPVTMTMERGLLHSFLICIFQMQLIENLLNSSMLYTMRMYVITGQICVDLIDHVHMYPSKKADFKFRIFDISDAQYYTIKTKDLLVDGYHFGA